MGDPASSLSNLVLTVGKLLYEEGIYLGAVAEKLERLRTELVWMKCFLKDAAAARRSKQEVVKAWVAEVRKNAYEAEDIIEMFDMEIACSKSRSCNINLKQAPLLHKMGNRIDGLVGRISDLNRRAKTYGINPHGGSETSTVPPRRETFLDDLVIERDDPVGFDTYIKKLESVLLDELEENRRYDVVTISGMGGLGKTTLARKVYHNKETRSHFSRFAWVSISKQFQTKEIWENILLQLESHKDEKRKKEIRRLTVRELGEQLCQRLQENNCLVVIDDLWDNDGWYSLKEAFPQNSTTTTTKILITSRNQGVAELEPNRFLLTPLCLNENQSMELFKKIAFPPQNQGTETHDNIAKGIFNEKMKLAENMIKHCRGLPLAIRVLGGLLKSKVTLAEWENVNEEITTQIARGGGSTGGQVNEGVRNILASSYDVDINPTPPTEVSSPFQGLNAPMTRSRSKKMQEKLQAFMKIMAQGDEWNQDQEQDLKLQQMGIQVEKTPNLLESITCTFLEDKDECTCLTHHPSQTTHPTRQHHVLEGGPPPLECCTIFPHLGEAQK